ncbi:MAG: hypothetical protein AABX70_05940 [Nanoarchaeota archaeon]
MDKNEVQPVPIAFAYYNKKDLVITLKDNPLPFPIKWKPVIPNDPKTGYYALQPDSEWIKIHQDCVLRRTKDSRKLQRFDLELQYKAPHILRVISLTSNSKTLAYEVYCKRTKLEQTLKTINILKDKYRDPKTFLRATRNSLNKALKEEFETFKP